MKHGLWAALAFTASLAATTVSASTPADTGWDTLPLAWQISLAQALGLAPWEQNQPDQTPVSRGTLALWSRWSAGSPDLLWGGLARLHVTGYGQVQARWNTQDWTATWMDRAFILRWVKLGYFILQAEEGWLMPDPWIGGGLRLATSCLALTAAANNGWSRGLVRAIWTRRAVQIWGSAMLTQKGVWQAGLGMSIRPGPDTLKVWAAGNFFSLWRTAASWRHVGVSIWELRARAASGQDIDARGEWFPRIREADGRIWGRWRFDLATGLAQTWVGAVCQEKRTGGLTVSGWILQQEGEGVNGQIQGRMGWALTGSWKARGLVSIKAGPGLMIAEPGLGLSGSPDAGWDLQVLAALRLALAKGAALDMIGQSFEARANRSQDPWHWTLVVQVEKSGPALAAEARGEVAF